MTGFNPNPGVGQVPFWDKIRLILAVLRIPWLLITFILRRLATLGQDQVALKRDLPISIIRGSIIRRPHFSGHWICKGAPGHATPPAACDIVLYYLHGGGYRVGKKDISIAVFGLEYSLTPEARFPAQINQAVAGYRYLSQDLGIETAKIGVVGYSAGGHLGLCLVSVLHELGVPAPVSYARNQDRDFISAHDLRGTADMLLRSQNNEGFSRFVDFTKALAGGRSWREVLTCKVWVAAGSDEIFLSDITRFVDVLMRDGVEVEFDVAEGGMHGGRLFDDVFDESAYLGSTGRDLPDGIMKGSATLARAILLFNGVR
ncbi:Alpha/Beta hydrolase protein [Delphinella strobiligena]|nr:Alpha/Beta hydrolase protein [Delphinella strobiligena]